MPYKIVQTLEKGKPVLTAVPHEWESDGTLFWPKNKAEKLLKIENSYPEDNWIPMPCTVKRNNVNSYQEAQSEINSMLYRSDTEVEEQINERQQRQTVALTSYNELANQCLMVPGDSADASVVQDNNIYIYSTDTYEETPTLPPATAENILEMLATVKKNQEKLPSDEILATLKTVKEDQEHIKLKLADFKSIQENQEKIILKLADLSVRFEKILKTENPTLSDIPTANTGIFSPIDSINELENLENDLKDDYKKSLIFKKYSVVCKGKGKGLNCAYILIDVLFTRKFLTKCSWAGGSRGEESKIAFKTYKNVINIFYNLIYDSDKSFSVTDCNTFFKNILRNSTKRNETKFMRTSACKTRLRKSQNILTQKKPQLSDEGYANHSKNIVFTNTPDHGKTDKESNEESDKENDGDEEIGDILTKTRQKREQKKTVSNMKDNNYLYNSEEIKATASTSKLSSFKNICYVKKPYTDSDSEKESTQTIIKRKNIYTKHSNTNLKQGIKGYYLNNSDRYKATASSSKIKPKKIVDVDESDSELCSEMESEEITEGNVTTHKKQTKNYKDKELVENKMARGSTKNKRKVETSESESNPENMTQEKSNKENTSKLNTKKMQKRESPAIEMIIDNQSTNVTNQIPNCL